MNKKGWALSIIAVVLVLMLLAIFLVGLATRDCHKNKDCSDDSYCGSDFECHPYPEEVVVTKNNFLPAAIVVGIALIAAAYIFRYGVPKMPLEKWK